MRNTSIFIATAIVSGIFLSSCDNQVKQTRIERIDSLGIHLNYVGESLGEMDSLMLVNRINDIDKSSNWVYDNITDTLSRKPGLIFGDYMRTRKYLGQSLNRYDEVSKELSYSEKQLQTLRADVNNSFYSEEEFQAYFITEAKSTARLVAAVDELKSQYEMSNARYTDLKPQVNTVIDSIKSVIYAPQKIAK